MSNTTFKDIQTILTDAVEGQEIGAHGNFWVGVTRDQFVKKSVFGCQIIHSEGGKFVGAKSPLVNILRGPIVCGSQRPQMPVGFDPVPPAKIKIIWDWIDAQCPE
jgi:hypothetical protein